MRLQIPLFAAQDKTDCKYRECCVCKDKKVPLQEFEEGKMTEWYEWQTKRFPRKSTVDKETKMVTMTVKEKEKGAIG
ncbi:hypothetical protein DPMN_106928 [Dreissena polymorpha]|uniref:Uncharacterized protein n=1 Tax=Dreissena polymorpha TaxID=45954 RepID=A0A9D4K5X0_DREPO|nr:hypothetical protein DPMN_106928 [Dreissena polymorpha]